MIYLTSLVVFSGVMVALVGTKNLVLIMRPPGHDRRGGPNDRQPGGGGGDARLDKFG